MPTVYELKTDTKRIADIQKATLETTDYGIEPTNGLFGSKEWWAAIDSGSLPIHTLSGKIRRVYMGSMNDWPEVEIVDGEGTLSRWTREVNNQGSDAEYRPGRNIEIDYVLQRNRPASWDRGTETKCVLAVRINDVA